MREASLPQHAPLVTASRQLPQTSCLCKSDGEPVTGLMSMHLAKHQVSKITCNCSSWPIIRNLNRCTRFFFLHPKVFFSHPKVFFSPESAARDLHILAAAAENDVMHFPTCAACFSFFQSSCFGVNGKEWWLWFITVALYSTWFIIFLILYVFVFSILI